MMTHLPGLVSSSSDQTIYGQTFVSGCLSIGGYKCQSGCQLSQLQLIVIWHQFNEEALVHLMAIFMIPDSFEGCFILKQDQNYLSRDSKIIDCGLVHHVYFILVS